jgi:hypothetical protein
VRAARPVEAVRAAFAGALPRTPRSARKVIDALIEAAETGLVATAGPRFFGFVTGGALPAATAAEVLAAGWDQCAFNEVLASAPRRSSRSRPTRLAAARVGIAPAGKRGCSTTRADTGSGTHGPSVRGGTMNPEGRCLVTTPDHFGPWPVDDFVPTEELVRRQGIRPLKSVEDLAAQDDPFGSDEEYEAFLADLYASRRAGLA